MKVTIILFNRGSGGNFLARILTLDPSTVCLGNANIDSAQDRCEYYCYSEPTISPNTHAGNGLSVWVDNELNHFYFPFTRGFKQLIEMNLTVVEPIHPDHYHTKIQLLGTDDRITLSYIETTGCENWIKQQIKHKIYMLNKTIAPLLDDTILNSIIVDQAATPINLKNIIESELTFEAEYIKICNRLELNSYPELALKIYRTWRRTWAPI